MKTIKNKGHNMFLGMDINIIIVFSHILPGILGFLAILCIINGAFDKQKYLMMLGVGLFALAAAIPFIVIPFLG
ncbi:MAG: hypothetical protein LBV42_04985 [Methanobrevibacter sp.]|jgi:hypothetical protein|nr:hypothetical protein [Methanobrevibacter sp.]